MLKKLITLTIVSIAICSASFADNALNPKPDKSPDSVKYHAMRLYSVNLNKDGNIIEIDLVDSKGSIQKFGYFDTKQNVNKYLKAQYMYDAEMDALRIVNGKTVLFDSFDCD